MLKQFYEKALPTQGVYCVGSFDSRMRNHFAETLDELFEIVEKYKKTCNIFVTPGSFEGHSRKADDCLFVKSFFIDLDVGENKEYATKGDAHTALYKLIGASGLPDPVVIDSGGGVHAYWIMDADIPKDEWKTYAEKFKALCQEHIAIDPVVTADAARFMRCPETTNFKYNPPLETSVVNDEIYVYGWEEFREFLGGPAGKEEQHLEDILASIPKGLDDDTKELLKLDNFARTFETLAAKSIEGSGCNQVANILFNAATLEEPLWWAGLSLAKHCDDGATAIHLMSEDHPDYNYEKTEQKANSIPAPKTCKWFIENYSEHCEGCIHRGSIVSPISLAREFVPAKPAEKITPEADTEESVWEPPNTKGIPDFPEFLMPYVRGQNGGIYFIPAPKVDKKGVKYQDDPVLILTNDLYPLTRMISPQEGECLLMRTHLPHDGIKDFLLPVKNIYSKEAFKGIMGSSGVLFSQQHDQHLMNYVIKWGQYLQSQEKALQMRMQMGWTEERTDLINWEKRCFVIGKKEYNRMGETVDAPSSPLVKGLARHMKESGTFARWRESIDHLNKPGFELHAFAAMTGFGSPIMSYTSTSGVAISLHGLSGCAKTGAMYAGLSVWGQPKELSVVEGTGNGFMGRYLGLHNILLGLDEVGDKHAEEIGKLIHGLSHGKAKIRMQASVNAERDYEMSASLIAMFTTNHALYEKLMAAKFIPTGEAARLVEFEVKKPQLLEDNENTKLGEYIFDAFKYNYGHAGPMYVKQLLTRGDNYIFDHIAKWEDKFLSDFGGQTEYRFYKNLVGATLGAGAIANENKITDFELKKIYEKVVGEMINIRNKIVKVNRADYPSLLGDFINLNMGNILVLKDGRVTMEPRGKIVARIVSEEGLVQVSKTEFKEFLKTRKVGFGEFENDMKTNGILIDDKKGRLTTGWKNAISIDSAYLYWFRTKVPDEWVKDDN